MEDAQWDRQWGNGGQGGGGSPLRNTQGNIITDLRNNHSITRSNISDADQQRLITKRERQRHILEEQIQDRARRKAKQKQEDDLWEQRYSQPASHKRMTAIEQRERGGAVFKN